MFAFLDIVIAYILTWPFLIGLFVFGIWFEHSESTGWAVFTAIIASIVAYFYFKVPLLNLLYYALGYSVVGVLWSFYRYKRFVRDGVEKINADKDLSESSRKLHIKYLHPGENLDKITAWVIVWPFSFIDNFVGDVINFVENLVKTYFKAVYTRIWESAIKEIQ
jgi:hypothetical protein